MQSFDDKNWVGMEKCLADEIYVDYEDLRGETPHWEDKCEYVRKRRITLSQLRTKHVLHGFKTSVNENEAYCKCSFTIERFNESGDYFHTNGSYCFHLVCIDEWQIRSIVQRVSGNTGNPKLHAFPRSKEPDHLNHQSI